MADHVGSGELQLASLLRQRLDEKDLQDLRRLFGRAPEEPNLDFSEDYRVAFDAALPAALQQSHVGDRQDATLLAEELLRQSPERRRFLVRNSPQLQTPRLATKLAEHSLEACYDNPREAIHLGELAVEVAEIVAERADDRPRLISDLRGQCWAFLGNAYRVSGDVQQAENAFFTSETFLEEGSCDLLLQARLCRFRGALAGDQGNLAPCFRLLDRAIRNFRQCGEEEERGRVLVHKALYSHYFGDTEEAIRLLREGLTILDDKRDPRHYLAASHNFVLFLTDLKRTAEARRHLEEIRPLYFQQGNKINLLRLRWVEGRMARNEGLDDEAEAIFLAARKDFVAEGVYWDAAFVSLELASIYLEQGKTEEIRRIANEVLPLFQTTGQEREGLAALILFSKAAELDKVSEQLIRSTASRLHALNKSH